MEFGVMAIYEWQALAGLCKALDESNFGALYVPDHPSAPTADPWAFLSYIAARTERIRLGTHVTALPMHAPAELAKQVATVDVLSGGRAILGVGAAYNVHEFEPYGYRFLQGEKRFALFEEALRVIKALWTVENIAFQGEFFQLSGGANLLPKPLQRPHPPIAVGGNSGARLGRIAAAHADAFNTWQLGPERVKEVKARLDEHCRTLGRDPASLRLTADVLGLPGGTQEEALELAWSKRDYARDAGRALTATDWDASGVLYGDEDAIAEQVQAFADAGVEELTLSLYRIDDIFWFSQRIIPRFQ